jgi:hypothetical protein
MTDATKKAVALQVALGFNTPEIKIYVQPAPTGHEWRCDIERGPGHHGIGNTPAEALMQAARAWVSFENGPGRS